MGRQKLSFKSSNVFGYSFSIWKITHFLRRFKNGFTSCEKSFINFQWKLIRPKKYQIPLTVTGLFQSLMASNLLVLGFTPSHMLQEVHFLLRKIHYSPCLQKVGFLKTYSKHILNVLHVIPLYLNTPIYHQYKWSRIHPYSHGKWSLQESWMSSKHYISQWNITMNL